MTVDRPRPVATAITTAFLLAAAGMLALGAGGVATASPASEPPTATPQPDYSKTTCVVTTTTRAQPGAFLSGETVAITRSAKAICALIPYPVHIVLVLDASASMAGEPNEALRNAMVSFVEGIAAYDQDDMRLGVVSFAQSGRQLCALTDQFDRVLACIRRVRAQGEGDIGAGLRLVPRTMDAGHGLWPTLPPDNIREVVILVSNGNAGSCDRVQRERSKLMDHGILLISVCAGRDCDVQCMRSVATSPRYFFGTVEQLLRAFEPIRRFTIDVVLKQLTITETLPADVRLVSGSPLPPATIILEDPTRLVWTTNLVSSRGVTVTYRVQPRSPGYVPLSAVMHGTFRDNRGLGGAFDFARPWARVLGGP